MAALLLHIVQAMLEHAVHRRLERVVHGQEVEAERPQILDGHAGLAVDVAHVGEHLPARHLARHIFGVIEGADLDDGRHLGAELDRARHALAAFVHLRLGIGVGAREQEAVGAFERGDRGTDLLIIFLARQEPGRLLHVVGVLELQRLGAGHREALGRAIDRERAAEAVLDVGRERDRRGLADAARDPFDIGQVAEAVIDHAVHRDRDFAARQHHRFEPDQLDCTGRRAIVDARRHDRVVGVFQQMQQRLVRHS